MHSETGKVYGGRPQTFALLTDVRCERLPYVRYDYYGKLRPSGRPPTVGPIQELADLVGYDRTIRLLLWPSALPDRPSAAEMKINL